VLARSASQTLPASDCRTLIGQRHFFVLGDGSCGFE
jgi:hypothetical protein